MAASASKKSAKSAPSITAAQAAEASVAELAALLANLQVPALPGGSSNLACESRLVEVRLGLASGLFTALRYKHAPTAAHSLRVALGCSSWAFAQGLDSEQREVLEVAALLHDVGKIGAPDCLLLKPGTLAGDEARLMDYYRVSGLNILANCCPSVAIVEIIRYSGGWYDGSRPNYPISGEKIPLGARMLAIVDAFDSMTTDQVYRPAMSRERAMHELFSHAGVQFDPTLVKAFSELEITVPLHRQVVGHWLHALDPRQSNRFWHHHYGTPERAAPPGSDALFHQKLLDNMHDAVIFVDRDLRVMQWNRGAERLTGIAAASVLGHIWSPNLIRMRDEQRGVGEPFECPLAFCIASGTQLLKRLLVADRNGRPVAVDMHSLPVVAPDGGSFGAAMILHDASGETTLEERCQTLQERATKDPLTQVANRAEFDRTHELFVHTHLEQRQPFSLIVADIDHFKSINDTFGHPAGDEVLRFVGKLLKSECRTGDLVARYGGEEFVILCAGCNMGAATQRAEALRRAMSESPQPVLRGKAVTASFGLTELQPGDSPDSMFRRADRALLEAKRLGRNLVFQLGSGWNESLAASIDSAKKLDGELCAERVLLTAVPVNLAVEKLKGFVLDHKADVASIQGNRIELSVAWSAYRSGRRASDRGVPIHVVLAFFEQRIPTIGPHGQPTGELSRSYVEVSARLKRPRDRRVADAAEQANHILSAIASYLMASEEKALVDRSSLRPAVNMLPPLIGGRK